jgi:hypothetical protein
MSTKFWKLTLRKHDKDITLFTVTTEAMIGLDLHGGSDTSLIHVGRQYHRRPAGGEQNHRDLAIAAIMAYATEPPYDRTGARIEETEQIPDVPPSIFVGIQDSVPIWEEEA